MLRDFIVIIAVIIMEVIIMTIIPRRELDEALREYKWLLIYGRRKTGKTFYVREVASYDRFFIVTRSREVLDIDTGERYSHREFERMIPLLLKEYRVVVDEFHRLGESFASVLQALSGVGRVILITSTMHFFRRVIGSPLIGLFNLRRVGLVDPRDAIIYVKRLGFEGRDLMELACIVREPWLAPMLEKYGIDIISK
ncbi:ATP-binding protein, partial [archaeon]